MKKTYKIVLTLLIGLILINPTFAHDGDHPKSSESDYDPFIQLILDS